MSRDMHYPGRIHLFSQVASVIGMCALLLSSAMAQSRDVLRVVYADWSSSVASAHVVCTIVEQRLDQACRLNKVSVEQMFKQVATGEADAMLSAWLPDTHHHYYQHYREQLEDLGANFAATRIGLVVPAVSPGRQTGPSGSRGRSTFEIHSIAELDEHAERFGGRIIGIEADTGIMRATREAMRIYNLDHFRLVTGNEQAMVNALKDAIQRKEPVIVTGWRPHWVFGRWTLRFLDDPGGVYGKQGAIHTLVNPQLYERMPRVHAFLDRFHWHADTLAQLMVWLEVDKGRDPMAQVKRWVRTNAKLIETWVAANEHPP
jgi:glycine betaine/proline transport system substrate-binding protein